MSAESYKTESPEDGRPLKRPSLSEKANPLATGIEQNFSNSVANEFSARRMANHRYSLRAFANHLGVDHSLLSKVLRGKARMGIPLMLQIGTLLKFREPWFLRLNELLEASRDSEIDFKKQITALKLRQRKVRNHSTIESDKVELISNWYDAVILEMTTLGSWQSNAKWISARLGGVVTPQQCEESLSRLARLDLVVSDDEGEILRANRETLMVGTDIPSERIRHFHREVMTRAIDSIENLSISDRTLMACTVPLKKEDIPRVQEVIKEAIRKITSLAVQSDADEIYQISNQMVRVTFDADAKNDNGNDTGNVTGKFSGANPGAFQQEDK